MNCMDCIESDYLSDKHKIASRSLPKKKLASGVISMSEACMWLKDGNAAIFNYSIPYIRYYVDGVETDTPTIARGDSFTNADCYKEGIESTYAMLLQCMGYFRNILGPIVSPIEGQCGSCENDGINMCTIVTHSSIDVRNASGEVTYFWEVAGCSLCEGQGTDTIEISTIGLYSINISVRCTVTDKYTTTVRESMCIHKRTHDDTGDFVLVPHINLKPSPNLVPYTGVIK